MKKKRRCLKWFEYSYEQSKHAIVKSDSVQISTREKNTKKNLVKNDFE